MTMKKLTLNDTAEFLLNHDHFCILTHRRPDGDTLGSAAALCLGQNAEIVMGQQKSRCLSPRQILRHHESLPGS